MISLDLGNGWAEISLGAPPVNAFDPGFLDLLEDRLSTVRSEGCAVVVFQSTLPVFSAGANLKVMAETIRTPSGRDAMVDTVRRMHAAFDMIEASPFVSIAKIRGVAVGGGYEFAMACDFRVASDTATVGLPEVTLGLLPGAGGTQRLPRLIGEAAAKRLILTGKTLPGPEAEARGLVDHCVADGELDAFVQSMRDEFAALPAHAIAACKRCFQAGREGFGRGSSTEIDETGKLYADTRTLALVDAFLERTRKKGAREAS